MKVTTFTKVLTASLLAAALAVTASAGFAKTKTYNANFADVKENAWYAKEVASAYELGFVDGVSDKEFSPDTTVTVAQGITMASRVHAAYNGKGEITGTGENWYDAYVKYAKDNGIITENQFDSYTRELKRYEMAELFYDAMPEGFYKAINNIKYIPDVPMGAMYWDKLLTLYNAGIVLGSDGYGSYNPDSSIKRSECAAIINRVAIPENRKQGELEDVLTRDAYVLAFNKGMAGDREIGIASGWVLDNRGGPARTGSGYGSVADVSTEYATAYIREFNYVPNGRLVVELNVKSTANGGFVEFRDIDEKSTYMIKIVDGKWSVLNKDGSYKAFAAPETDTFFRIVIDLDKNTSTTFINNVNYGDAALLSDNILSMRAGIDEKGTGSFTISEMDIPANYAVYEDFDMFGIDEVYGWTAAEGTKVSNGELYVNSSKVTKKFDAVKGIVTLQTYFISRDGKDLSIDLDGLVKLEAKSKKLVVDGKELYNLTQNMWYRLKVEADINTGKANIWLNGRVIGVVNLAKKAPATSLTFETVGNTAFDNIYVYETLEHADYVPAPEAKASLDDYIVSMNVCSLWRNGVTDSWACISPYDDHSPLIGYFDEGIPETADWEIKQMVDHGIDVQAFCWYGSSGSGPMKYPSHSAQLHEGYMYAKYSDYMKYCLIWETSSATGFSSGQFRNYIIPYWFENYFLDDRYLKIDNKLVLSIYNAEGLATAKYFGSNAATKTELEFLESKAKEYGFDGVIFIANGIPNQQFYEMGFDGTHAYSWGEDGRKLSENKSRISSAASSKTVYGIPTVSVGFDSVPWHNVRYGMISVEDYNKALEWLTTEQMPNNKVTPDWAKKLIWLSTWNEYGEGTFITPCGFDSEGRGHGYGYLDALRKYTTNLPEEHEDLIPTPSQQARICHLYPQYARVLRREGWYKYEKGINAKKNIPENKLVINNVDILANSGDDFFIPPVEKDGKVYFPFNPSTGVNYILNCHYNWRKNAGTFEIFANGHTLKFAVGSDMYYKDGKYEKLGYTVTTLDGVPYFDFVKLAKDLGLKVEEKDGNINIWSDNYESAFKAIEDRKLGWWDFNGYDTEGWSSTMFDYVVGGGTMTMTSNSSTRDPSSHYNSNSFPKDFYTKRFTDFEIKARFKYDQGISRIKFYFITDKDKTWDETKSIWFQLQENDTQGEWRTFTKKLSEIPAWNNAERITGIRFDPFDAVGTMEIDYIHFIEDPDFVYVPPVKKEFAIQNGDAEKDEIHFYNSGTKISRIAEPGNEKNHVYYIESSAGGCYAYFRHAAEFEIGATYRIEYDIKLVGNNVDDPKATSSTFCTNIRYPDKTASGAIEHILRQGTETSVSPNIDFKDGWVHYVGMHTVKNMDDTDGSEFTIYVNPNNGIGFDYYIDNVVVKKLSDAEKAKADPQSTFDWETAEGPLYTFDDGKHPFKFSALEGKVEDGVLVMTSTTSHDVQAEINNLKLDANKAVAVAIRYKAEFTDTEMEKTSFDVFFGTKDEPTLTGDKCGNTKPAKYIDEGDGWYTVVVNMAINPKWKGTITTLRLDPANAHGTYYFDKVQIYEVSEK